VCKEAYVFHPDDAALVAAELRLNVARSSYDQSKSTLTQQALARFAAGAYNHSLQRPQRSLLFYLLNSLFYLLLPLQQPQKWFRV
jgi:hypothetical protein